MDSRKFVSILIVCATVVVVTKLFIDFSSKNPGPHKYVQKRIITQTEEVVVEEANPPNPLEQLLQMLGDEKSQTEDNKKS